MPDAGSLAPVTIAPPRPPKRAFTGRAAVLAVVLLGLLMSVAYPLQDYLRQRGDIAALRAQRDQIAQSVSDLQTQSARWEDPAYVKQQAKERLYFVTPGERTYVVIGEPGTPAPADRPQSPSDAGSVGTWYERLWSTVGTASRPTAKQPTGTPRTGTRPTPATPPAGGSQK
jgi:cell division protein FtsB